MSQAGALAGRKQSPSRIDNLTELLERTTTDPATGCMIWNGPKDGCGYGSVRYQGRVRGTHRLAYQASRGVVLTSQEHVCHSCDNPPCINPDHLWLGDTKTNSLDMAAKGRAGSAKLTPEQVREIRADYFAYGRGRHAQCNGQQLAEKYNVCIDTIRLVASGKTWRTA